MQRPILGITMGDPAGIGAEIAVKALEHRELYSQARPVVIGSREVMEDALLFSGANLQLDTLRNIEDAEGRFGTIDLFDLANISLDDFHYGEISAVAGRAALDYIMTAIELAKSGRIAAVVTGPIHKEAIKAAGCKQAGHTEIFASETGAEKYAMLLIANNLRVIHVSTHVSLRQACDLVTRERVLDVIQLADQALKNIGVVSPRTGVAGLNPHAGEQGLFGREEMEEIGPAVKAARQMEIDAAGPIPPDTLFSRARGGEYDMAVAMYHDQGHIPLKLIGFQYEQSSGNWSSVSGVNVTVGLPIIRTSVDHGVAFDRAGQGRANEESLVEAVKLAAKMAQGR